MRRWMMWSVVVVLAVGVAAPAISGLPISGAEDPLVMMSVSPCAIFDTRTAVAGPMAGGETRSFGIVGFGDFTAQGGPAAGCGVPGFDGGGLPQAQAVLLNLVAISPAGGGNLKAWAGDASEATGGVVNYQALAPPMNNSNAIVVELNQTAEGEDIKVKANGAEVHVRGVVLGYFVSGHDTSLDTFVIAAAKDAGDQGGIDSVTSPGKLLVESAFTTAFPADAVVTASVTFATGPTTATSVVIWLEVDTAGDPERCADYVRDQGKNAAWREESLIAASRVEISVTAAIPLPAAGSHTIALCAQAFPEIAGVQIAGLTGVVSPSPNNDVTVTFLAP